MRFREKSEELENESEQVECVYNHKAASREEKKPNKSDKTKQNHSLCIDF